MKLFSTILVATLCYLPGAYASESLEFDHTQLIPAESFSDLDQMNAFLGMNEMSMGEDRGRPGQPNRPPVRPGQPNRPPVRPGPPNRPPVRPGPPHRPPVRPGPPHRPPVRPFPPPYRPYPPPYLPVPPPHYYGYVCYAENYRGQMFDGHSSVAQWAQDEAMRKCQTVSYQCRPMGCRYR